jgi:spermidine/putrescine transport system substrate-binding protein
LKKKLFLILIIIAALIFSGCGGEKRETLNVFNWGEYIDEDLIRSFEPKQE